MRYFFSVPVHPIAHKSVHFWQSEVLQWRGNWFLDFIHILQTMQSLNWYHMICDSTGFCAVDFMTSNVIGTKALPFNCTNSQFFCSGSWKWPCLGPLKHFYMLFVLINFICCLHLWIYPSEALNLLVALQLYFFSVWLIRVNLKVVL
jgi:hypothetical protein